MNLFKNPFIYLRRWFFKNIWLKRTTYKVESEHDSLQRYLANWNIIYNKEQEQWQLEEMDAENRKSTLDKLKEAYTIAWQNRNFEIDKFWLRVAYFWGFIVVIFGAYFAILSAEEDRVARLTAQHIDLYLLLIGLLFSQAWYFVIMGSKRWQENWEIHIDHLEDFISGPIYKHIHYNGKNFYSVSKLNEMMAWVIIFLWSGLLLQYFFSGEYSLIEGKPDVPVLVAVILAAFISLVLRRGYTSGDMMIEGSKRAVIHRWNHEEEHRYIKDC